MIKEKISIIFFFFSVFGFCFNLQSRVYDNYKIAFFWLTILVMIGAMIYQIYFSKKYQYVLFEIIIFCLLLHLVYQIGYFGLRGSDSYFDYNFLKTILDTNNFTLGTNHITGWPLLHIFSAVLSWFTDINSLIVAKFLPSFISSIIVISIYLLIINVYESKKVALFSCLLFGTIPQFVSFEAVFIREIFGIFFFILFIFVLYVSKQRNDTRLKILSVLLIPVILLSHHFSAFMLVIFLTIYIISSTFIPFLYRKKMNMKFSKINIRTFYLLFVAAILFYWLFITAFIFKDFFSIYYEAIGIREFVSYAGRIDLGTSIVTVSGNIRYYGFFIFNGVLCIILLIKLLYRREKHFIEDFSFIMFLYFCLFLGFLSLFVLGSLIFPDRFIPFGFMLGLVPLTMFLFSQRNKVAKRAFLLFLVSFLIFNIYNIDSDQYIGDANMNGGITTEKEYAIAESMTIPKSYYGYIGVSDAIFDIQEIRPSYEAGRNPLSTVEFLNKSNFAIIYKGMYIKIFESVGIKSPQLYERITTVLSYEDTRDLNKVSDLGDIFLLSWKQYS
jgi:hypothetical protein